MAVKNIKSYLSAVQKKFPYLSKEEIEKILDYGMRSYVRAMKMYCDVNLHRTNGKDQGIYCMDYHMDRLKIFQYWVSKWRMKERYLFKMRKQKWDGYYYIGITYKNDEHVQIKGDKVTFRKVYFTKLAKELRHQKFIKTIWRIPAMFDGGWKFFVEEYTTDKAEFVGKNDYEKYHQCFLGRFNHGYAPDVDTTWLSNGCSECNAADGKRE